MVVFTRPPGTMFLIPPPPLFVGFPSHSASLADAPVPLQVEEPAALLRAKPPSDQSSLQAIFMTEEELDLGKIAELVCSLPGIAACVATSGEMTATFGEIPPQFDLNAVGSAAADLFRWTGEFTRRLKLGALPGAAHSKVASTWQASSRMSTYAFVSFIAATGDSFPA